MNANFQFDPSAISTTFEVFPKDVYEVILKEPKTFYQEGKDGGDDRGGIRFNCEIAEGEHAGKLAPIACNFGDNFGKQHAKQILMAVHGFDPKIKEQELMFNNQVGPNEEAWDFSLDVNEKTLGDAWLSVKGKRVYIELDVFEKTDTDGNVKRYQQFKAAIPIAA